MLILLFGRGQAHREASPGMTCLWMTMPDMQRASSCCAQLDWTTQGGKDTITTRPQFCSTRHSRSHQSRKKKQDAPLKSLTDVPFIRRRFIHHYRIRALPCYGAGVHPPLPAPPLPRAVGRGWNGCVIWISFSNLPTGQSSCGQAEVI